MSAVIVCSFSGSLGELKRGHRTVLDGLRALATDPRVSVFERGAPWLESLLDELKRAGLIADVRTEPYPWCRFSITDAGRTMLATPQPHTTKDRA